MVRNRSLPDEVVAFVQSIAIATLSFVLQSSFFVLLLFQRASSMSMPDRLWQDVILMCGIALMFFISAALFGLVPFTLMVATAIRLKIEPIGYYVASGVLAAAIISVFSCWLFPDFDPSGDRMHYWENCLLRFGSIFLPSQCAALTYWWTAVRVRADRIER